jgi:hypothetical protein
MLNQIVELLVDRKIFVRQRKKHETKVIAILVYHAVSPIEKPVRSLGIWNRSPMNLYANSI